MIKTENKMLKRVCILGLSATMLAGMVMPVSDSLRKEAVITQADTSYDGEFKDGGRTYKYKNDGNNISLISVTDGGELKIPSSVTISGKSRKVTSLGKFFGTQQTFTKVIVPDSVTSIGHGVFSTATMDYLKLSSNIETIDDWFASDSNIKKIECKAKNIKSIGKNCLLRSKGAERVILGNWLAKYKTSGNVIDISAAECEQVNQVIPYSGEFTGTVDTLKVGKNKFLLKHILNKVNFTNGKLNLANIYVDGKKVVCSGASDTIPEILQTVYDRIEYSDFDLNYAKTKAKYVLTNLGIPYLGGVNSKTNNYTGTQKFNIAKRVHDYIFNNFEYDAGTPGLYTRVFNCGTTTKCIYDAEMYAFLMEMAGFDAEAVCSAELIPVTEAQKEQYKKENKKYQYTINGKYRVGRTGCHAWAAVNLNNTWYYVDITTDRQIDSYGMFLVSNDFIDREDEIYPGAGIHAYPHFTEYANTENEKKMHPFQNYKTMLQKPKTGKNLADLDMDRWLSREYDYKILTKLYLESSSLTNSLLNSKNGIVNISDEDAKKLNSGYTLFGQFNAVKIVEKVNGKWKLVIDPNAGDINFDGKVNQTDYVLGGNLLNKPSMYKGKKYDSVMQ